MNQELADKIKTYLSEKPNRTFKNLKKDTFIKVFGLDNYNIVVSSTNFLNQEETFSLHIRCFVEGMTEYPKCDTCGKNTKFDGSKWGKTCSKKCNLASPLRLQKTAETNIKKYGTSEYFASLDSRKKIEYTNLKKYNNKTYLNSDLYKDNLMDYDFDTIPNEYRKKYYDTIKNTVIPLFKYDETFPCLDKVYNWECTECGIYYSSDMTNYSHQFCPECKIGDNSHIIKQNDDTLKNSIISYVGKEYEGSFRFLKYKMFIEFFGVEVYLRVLERTQKIPKKDNPFCLMVKCFTDGIEEVPKCELDGCTNLVKYNSIYGWQKYCSYKCNANSEERMNRLMGSNNYFANPENIIKIKNNNLVKYGVVNYSQTEEYKNRLKSGDIIRNSNPEQISLTKLTNHYNYIDSKFTKIKKLFSFDEYRQHGSSTYHRYKWSCNVCEHKFEWWLNMGCEPICPRCKPKGTKHEILLKNLLDRYNIDYIFRDRKVLGNGQEIDIYIPSKKLGIEINGLYYHTDNRLPKSYHYDKMILMKNKGNDLIHIFGDELLRKERIVLNKLKYRLGLINRNIGARECEIKEIDNKTKTKFLNKYHIQGDVNAEIKLGLFYKHRLVAVMTFGEPRNGIGSSKHQENTYELIRFCTIFNFNISGAAGKLIKFFKSNFKWDKIYSYADRRWSNGKLYEKLGFDLTDSRNYNYWYTKNHTERLHRSGFRKEKRSIKLENHDPSLSEVEDMKNNGYDVVWDCGTLTYTITNNKI
jgi:hypothetical protein